MKKQILLALTTILLSAQAFAAQVKVNVHAKGDKGKSIAVVVEGQQYAFKLNEEKKGSVTIDIEKPTWAHFSYMGDAFWVMLYLSPGNDVNIDLDVTGSMTGMPRKLSFPVSIECRDGGLTDFMVKYQRETSQTLMAPFKPEVLSFSGKDQETRFDDMLNFYKDEINKTGISDEYKTAVNGFIKYNLANAYLSFIFEKVRNQSVKLDDDYYQKLESLIQEVPGMIGMRNYHDFLRYAVLYKYNRGDLKPIEYYTKAAKEMAQFKNPSIKLQPMSIYVQECITRFGAKGTEELQKIFLEQANDPRANKWVESLVAQYSALDKGAPSPTFNYEDVNGKMVSLESLKGKYVYIDMWATWCGPCKAEIPHLAKLEHDYVNKNIHFVSISNDAPKDKEKWKTVVKEKNMGGIQLFANGDQEFGRAYKVKGIPRFILIDKEGNIVASEAPRPSDPKTRELFDSLEGI
ncbi:TlpA family protein disulfide reductase [Marinifilum sp.]|uniref:TlpA family protein disulfide reductase n=1 Tax=Marinifilum sp. TaxID=2033137 RepID=UPI003BAB6A79